MPPNHFESEVESFLEGSHGDRTHIKRADHHTVTPLCGTLLCKEPFDVTLYLLTDSPLSRLCGCMHTSSNEVHERRYKVRLRINLV